MSARPNRNLDFLPLFIAGWVAVACGGKAVGPDSAGEVGQEATSNGTPGTDVGSSTPGSPGSAGSPDESVPTTGVATGASGNSSGSSGTCAPLRASAQCGPNPTGSVPLTSLDDLTTAMVHRWILCGGHESVFAVDGGDIGLDITSDNHWYKLYLGEDGGTVRGAGFDEEGTWDALDLGDHYQVNLQIMGSGTVITAPVFAATPAAMRLDNNGVFQGNYVLDPTIPESTVRCPATADPTRSGACTPADESAIAIACPELGGKWARCGGAMPGAPAHDGIELEPDGSFYFLHRGANDALVHAAADRATASFEQSCNGQFNFHLTTSSGAKIESAAQLRNATPRQLWIFTGPEWGDPERYVFDGP